MEQPNSADDADEPTVAQKQFARRHVWAYVVVCIVIGLSTAAFFAKSWPMFWAALGFGTAYAMFLMLFMVFAITDGKPDEEEEAEANH